MRRLGAFFALSLEVLVFYRAVLFNSARAVIPWDLRYYHFPQAHFIARQLQAGLWPLWNPWVYCGMPWYAKLDAQLFYPPTALVILISNWFGGRRLWYFLELQVVAHVLAAGLFTYLLVRRLGAGRAASLIAATIYQLGAFFTTQAQHVGAVNAAAWLPLAWLGIEMLAGGFSWPRLAVLAAALSMTILAGYPAAGIPIVLSCGALALLLVGLARARWGLAGLVPLAGLWAGGLAALPLLPALEMSGLSHAGLRGHWQAGLNGIPPQAFWTLVWPNYFGVYQFGTAPLNLPWDVSFLYLYCGIPALVLFLAALLGGGSRRAWVYGAIAAASGLWMVGTRTPAGLFVRGLFPPALRGAIYFEFGMCVFVLGLAVTAGLGADRLLRSRPLWLQIALIAVVAGDLTLAGSSRPFNTSDRRGEPAIGYHHFEQWEEIPRTLRRLTGQDYPPSRIDLYNGSPLWNNGAMLFEVPSATGDDPFAPLRVLKVRNLFAEQIYWVRGNQVRQLDSPLLDLLNVRYLISSGQLSPDEARRAGLRQVAELPRHQIYENTEALPRFFLVGGVLPARDVEQAAEMLAKIDPRREAVVEAAEAGWPLGPEGRVKVVRYSAGEVVLETDTPGGGYLVSSETHYPGWRAWVDGTERPLYMTNGAFRGLPVPAGRHQVRMSFQPPLLWASAAIGGLAWLLLGAAVLARPRGDRSRGGPPPAAPAPLY